MGFRATRPKHLHRGGVSSAPKNLSVAVGTTLARGLHGTHTFGNMLEKNRLVLALPLMMYILFAFKFFFALCGGGGGGQSAQAPSTSFQAG